MNRFRTKKKAKDELAPARPSVDSDGSKPFRMFTKKQKARDDEVDNSIDLATALPSSDDFRTSLLMTGLSARFSMLREQDDPNSKIGKASDDSVLFKRQSRMDFGMSNGLHDIAEVESIKTPPFARFDSFQSDDASSISGSIMGRSKPSDGNNLFGGRQKIYKITGSGGTAKPGGLPGRALYEDDVSYSAFQKWRQAEKQRASLEEDRQNAESDLSEFNKRRETNSTTSSAPSITRSSTAATSVTSQMAPSVKDWSTPATTPNSIAGPPILERNNVTRTRRLYEQGLTQDLQDQQSMATSRMDTLSRRNLGNRTPDLASHTSPTNGAFAERAPERRALITKASAPNLRSFSPPTTSSSRMSPAESSNPFPGLEQKPSFGSQPPLSPPISESEDHPTLNIQPNDRGKATAMGVFARPPQQYDESKYAMRQRQLQHGRDTPTNRFRTESNASIPTTRSRSSSSINRATFEKSEPGPVKKEPTVQEESSHGTFFDDDDDAASTYEDVSRLVAAPRVMLERPDDQEHPAFRKSALPTPLTLSAGNSNDVSPIDERNEFLSVDDANSHSADSPTLGDGSGLSGMVRQHLRNESTASSIYGPPPEESESDIQLPPNRVVPAIGDLGIDSGDWGLSENDWKMSYEGPTHAPQSQPPPPPTRSAPQPSPPRSRGSDADTKEEEEDEFARHLADGARRVREKLTSYVDTDSGASTPIPPPSDSGRDASRTRGNAFGMLRSKSSKGSLVEKSRDRSRSRPRKLVLEQSSTSPPSKKSIDVNEDIGRNGPRSSEDRTAGQSQSPGEKEDNAHAGLKAFRQARRELQKMKEMEVQQRRQTRERSSTNRSESQDNMILPATTYDNRAQPQEKRPPMPSSRSDSRQGSDRDRSGSETSAGGQSHRGPQRSGHGSGAYDEMHSYGHMNGAANGPRQGPMMRSPPQANGDMKRPPMMGPGSSPGPYSRSVSSNSLGLKSPGMNESGLPSPASFSNGMHSPMSGPGSPTGHRFGATASTPNLRGGSAAPPLPPINPRRKNTQPGMRRPSEDEDRMSPRLPTSPSKSSGGRSTPIMTDDDGGNYRRMLRKGPSDTMGTNTWGRANSPAHGGAMRPPIPRTNSSNGSMPGGLPGGMI